MIPLPWCHQLQLLIWSVSSIKFTFFYSLLCGLDGEWYLANSGFPNRSWRDEPCGPLSTGTQVIDLLHKGHTHFSFLWNADIVGKLITMWTFVLKDASLCSCLIQQSGPSTCCSSSNHLACLSPRSSCAVRQNKHRHIESGCLTNCSHLVYLQARKHNLARWQSLHLKLKVCKLKWV